MFESIMGFIVGLPGTVPTEVWTLLGASGIVSLLLQRFKKWFSLQSDKVITFFLVVLSALPAAYEALVAASVANPELFGAYTAMIMGAAQVVYRFLIKPFSNLVNDAKKLRDEQLQLKTRAAVEESANKFVL